MVTNYKNRSTFSMRGKTQLYITKKKKKKALNHYIIKMVGLPGRGKTYISQKGNHDTV